jgi:hypothetical protein
MRERLIELLEQAKEEAHKVCGSMNEGFGAWYADHLLANGVIVLPCKVGDTVWFVDRKYDLQTSKFVPYVNEGYVKAIKFSARPTKITVEYPDVGDKYGRCKGADYFAHNIGKTVFLTREEAEAKLESIRE